MSEKKFIVWNMSDNGYSLGIICEACISKAKHNAKIMNQNIKIEELHDDKYNKCTYCWKELISKRGIQLMNYRKRIESMTKKLEELYKSNKITQTELINKMRLPMLLELSINCELDKKSYLEAYRHIKLLNEINKISAYYLF